jgi:hypothetical protein
MSAVVMLARITIESCVIESCHDGDTCTTTDGEKIRLANIDAPELNQPGGKASRDQLRSWVVGRTVEVHKIAKDRYGRTVASMHTMDGDIGAEMVASKHARDDVWNGGVDKNTNGVDTYNEYGSVDYNTNGVDIYNEYGGDHYGYAGDGYGDDPSQYYTHEMDDYYY